MVGRDKVIFHCYNFFRNYRKTEAILILLQKEQRNVICANRSSEVTWRAVLSTLHFANRSSSLVHARADFEQHLVSKTRHCAAHLHNNL